MKLPKYTYRYAVCALILNKDMKVLGVSRKDDPNDWGFPGGKVDTNESLDIALKREVLEETGYTIEILDMDDKDVTYHQKDKNFVCITYICTINEDIPQQPISEKETGHVKWIPLEELLKGTFKHYNKLCLQHFKLLG